MQESNDERNIEGSGDCARKSADGCIHHVVEYKHAAEYRDEHVQHMTDVAEYGHKHIGVTVGAVGLIVERFVYLVEVSLCRVLVAKHLYDLLSVHHLLDVALEPADGHLHRDKVLARAAADYFGDEHYDSHAAQNDESQPKAVPQHDKEQRQHHYRRREKLRQRLRHHLPERVYVVGVVAHDIAVLIGVEVLYRQILHAVEHSQMQFFEIALRDHRHHLLVNRAEHERHRVQSDKCKHVPHDLAAVSRPTAVVYRRADNGKHALHEYRRERAYDRVDRYAEQRESRRLRIRAKQRFEHSAEHALFRRGALLTFVIHCRLLCSASCRPRYKYRFCRGAVRACRRRLSCRRP